MFTVLKLLSGLVFWRRRVSCGSIRKAIDPHQCDDALSLGTCTSITVIRSLTDVKKHFGDRASTERPFVVGGRVQRKDGSAGRGTVTDRCDLIGRRNRYGKQRLAVKWDGGVVSAYIDETNLVHESFVVGDRVRRWPGSAHVGTVTEQCNGYRTQHLVVKWDSGASDIDRAANLRISPYSISDLSWADDVRPEGEKTIKHCVFCVSGCSVCGDGWGESRVARWASFAVSDLVRREDGSPGWGTITERGENKYGYYLTVKWAEKDSVYIGETPLVHVNPHQRNDNCDDKILQFDIGDRVRRKNRLGAGVGTVTQCWPRHLFIKWDGGLGVDVWGRAGLVHSTRCDDKSMSWVATGACKPPAHDNDCLCCECCASRARERNLATQVAEEFQRGVDE